MRVVPLIYCLMNETKNENYMPALKIVKEEMQKMVWEEQETKLTSAERPPKDPIGPMSFKNTKLALIEIEFAQSIPFSWPLEEENLKKLYKNYTPDTSVITKKMIKRYPVLCSLKKDDILKAVKLLDIDD
ncbi:hypothetical protein DSO57_1015303 [Entomophthora muscae]|uniref:Uncharacterized protein n=1 Tax=Entomophthora muscae TaxID=34485 RepID=A0ACC2TG19_9FUNG|nr:hypothetical protein DSO57_1015303 [Entomophthora muscae]